MNSLADALRAQEVFDLTGDASDTDASLADVACRPAIVLPPSSTEKWEDLVAIDDSARSRWICASATVDLGACVPCRGTGYVTSRDERGYSTASPCECHGLRLRIDAFNRARLPAGQGYCTRNVERMRGQGCAPDIMAAFIDGWRPGRRGLMVSGGNRLGKTHLVCRLVKALTLRMGVCVRYIEVGHLLELLKATFGDDNNLHEWDITGPLTGASTELLVLDDVGRRDTGSEWIASVYEGVLADRLDGGRTTIVVTNLDPSAHRGPTSLRECVGDRVFSRILGHCEPVPIAGRPYVCGGDR